MGNAIILAVSARASSINCPPGLSLRPKLSPSLFAFLPGVQLRQGTDGGIPSQNDAKSSTIEHEPDAPLPGLETGRAGLWTPGRRVA